jgi:hypothetical protein
MNAFDHARQDEESERERNDPAKSPHALPLAPRVARRCSSRTYSAMLVSPSRFASAAISALRAGVIFTSTASRIVSPCFGFGPRFPPL